MLLLLDTAMYVLNSFSARKIGTRQGVFRGIWISPLYLFGILKSKSPYSVQIQTRKPPNPDTFHAVPVDLTLQQIQNQITKDAELSHLRSKLRENSFPSHGRNACFYASKQSFSVYNNIALHHQKKCHFQTFAENCFNISS